MDAPVQVIADRLNAKPEQVLLAWAKAKGVVVVTCVLDLCSFCVLILYITRLLQIKH